METLNSQEQYGGEKVFVEIGFGWDPAYLFGGESEVRRNQFKDVHYIGIDLESREVNLGKDATSRHNTNHLKSIGLNEGKITDLHIAEHSVDEVYLANVLGGTHAEQDVLDFGLVSFDMAQRIEQETDPDRKKMLLKRLYPVTDSNPQKPLSVLLSNLEKVKDLLKPGGQLTIVENNTPPDVEITKLLLEDIGFEIVKVITPVDEFEWKSMHAKYHIQEGAAWDEPYIVIAHPKE